MYIVSLKLDRKKVLGAVAVLCIATAMICVASPRGSRDVLGSNVSTAASSVKEHVAFLNAYGYSVGDKPVQIREIIIPERFSEDYENYNGFQKLSGFDLSKYKSKRVKKYTYKVINYDGSDDEVVANIMVYNNRIIGGDISSTAFGGFMHGFVKE